MGHKIVFKLFNTRFFIEWNFKFYCNALADIYYFNYLILTIIFLDIYL